MATIDFSKTRTEDAKKSLKESKSGLLGKHTEPKPKTAEITPVVVEDVLGVNEPAVEPITLEAVKRAYPKKIPDELAESIRDRLNLSIEHMEAEGIGQFFKEISIGYINVLGENKSNSLEEFVNASKFLSFRAVGDTLTRAYARTFPDRVSRMEREGTPMSYLHTYAQSYSKTTLVTKLQSAMAIPHHILFQDVFYKAVQTQADIMVDNSVSPKVRSDAANSLLTHLKTPEVKQMELNVGIQESNILEQFKEAMSSMAGQQKQMIDVGSSTVTDVSHQVIYTEESEE